METTIYCFDLILMLGLPAIVVMDKLMHIWLVDVPDYAVVFTQWIIAKQIIGTFSSSFYIPMMAAIKMEENSLAALVLGISEFVLVYFFLKIGFGPMWIQYLSIIAMIFFSMLVKPYVLIKHIDYSLKEITICYWICLKTLILSCVIFIIPICFLGDSLIDSIMKVIIVGISVLISSYVFLGKQTKEKLKLLVISKIKS